MDLLFWAYLVGGTTFTIVLAILVKFRQMVPAILVLTLGISILLCNMDILMWTLHNPQWIALGLLGYFVTGLIWTKIRWTLWCIENKNVLRVSFESYSRYHSQNDIFNQFRMSDSNPFRIEANITNFVLWACFWPFSMIWFLIAKPITFMFNLVVANIVASFNGVVERHIKALIED